MRRIRWRTIGRLIHRELAIDAYRGNFDQESIAQQKITRETTARQGLAGARRGAELGATEGTLCAHQIERQEALHRDAITSTLTPGRGAARMSRRYAPPTHGRFRYLHANRSLSGTGYPHAAAIAARHIDWRN